MAPSNKTRVYQIKLVWLPDEATDSIHDYFYVNFDTYANTPEILQMLELNNQTAPYNRILWFNKWAKEQEIVKYRVHAGRTEEASRPKKSTIWVKNRITINVC
jgi:hypothetical protein